MDSFGKRLQVLRKRKGLGVRELERQAGIKHGIVSRLERESRATPSLSVAMALAKTLGVTLDYLAGMYEDMEEETISAELAPA